MTDFSRLRKHVAARISVNDEEFVHFTTKFKVVNLKKRDKLSHTGDLSRLGGFVNKGCMRTYYTDAKANDHVISLSFEDWWVSDLRSFFTGEPAFYTIEALEDCELFVLNFESQEKIYAEIPCFERYFRLLVQNAFIASQNRVMDEMLLSAEERYTRLIGKYPSLELRVAQQHIASFLGITPEALSRIRKTILEREKKNH